jgi:hypothetical protein
MKDAWLQALSLQHYVQGYFLQTKTPPKQWDSPHVGGIHPDAIQRDWRPNALPLGDTTVEGRKENSATILQVDSDKGGRIWPLSACRERQKPIADI